MGSPSAHPLRKAFEAESNAPGVNHTVRPDTLGNWVKRDIELLGAAEDVYQKALADIAEAGAPRAPGNREKRELR